MEGLTVIKSRPGESFGSGRAMGAGDGNGSGDGSGTFGSGRGFEFGDGYGAGTAPGAGAPYKCGFGSCQSSGLENCTGYSPDCPEMKSEGKQL